MEKASEDSAAVGAEVRVKGEKETATLTDEEVKLRFDYVQRDIGKLETAVSQLTATIQTTKFQGGKTWPNVITILLLIIPMYALVIDLIARGIK